MSESLTSVQAQRLETNRRLAELAVIDGDLDDDEAAEFAALTDRSQRLSLAEQRLLEAAPAPEPAPAVDAFAQLVAEADVRDVFAAAVYGRRVTGATAELQAEVGCTETQVPLDLFAASTVSAAGGAEHQEPTVAQIFPTVMTAEWGVDRRPAPTGKVHIPRVTAPTAGPTGEATVGTKVPPTTATIVDNELAPAPLTMVLLFDRVAEATFPGLEGDLMRILTDAMANAMDNQALYAAGKNGLMNFGTDPSDATVVTYESGLAKVLDSVDGLYATRHTDLRTLLGVATYNKAAALYRSGGSEPESLIDTLTKRTGGVRTSSLVAAPSSDNQGGVVSLGGQMAQAQRVWSMEMIADRVTKADANQIQLTLSCLQDTKMIRPETLKRLTFHLA
ncbi:MAG: hypothetical protein OXG44_20625 [Gammaproteobacteria bacterium]|nr:hypothetical protein [Gammaproteobacteria bacterium]